MPRSKKASRGREAKYPSLGKILNEWVIEHRSNGISVSTKMMQNQAKKIALDLDITNFRGSGKWCYLFMKRNGLCMRVRTHLAQRMPEFYQEKTENFHKHIVNFRRIKNYEYSQIINMDEVPVNFYVPGNKTVDIKGRKSITIKTTGNEKNRFTVVLTCCADGSKLPPMIIFKRKKIPKNEIPEGIIVHVQGSGWMDEQGMKVWSSEVLLKRQGGKEKNPALLVFDSFKAHLSEQFKNFAKKNNIDLAVIPEELTCQLQPLDVSINKPFKDSMLQE